MRAPDSNSGLLLIKSKFLQVHVEVATQAAEAGQVEVTAVLLADTNLHHDQPLWQRPRCLQIDTWNWSNYFLIVLFVCLFLTGAWLPQMCSSFKLCFVGAHAVLIYVHLTLYQQLTVYQTTLKDGQLLTHCIILFWIESSILLLARQDVQLLLFYSKYDKRNHKYKM